MDGPEMTDVLKETEGTADELLDDFKGSSLKRIIIFTVVIHVVLVVGTSIFYLWNVLTVGDVKDLPEEKRMEMAIAEVNRHIRRTADQYDILPKVLSESLDKKASAAGDDTDSPDSIETDGTNAVGAAAGDTHGVGSDTGETNSTKSAMEKRLEMKAEGPAEPDMDVDLFQ